MSFTLHKHPRHQQILNDEKHDFDAFFVKSRENEHGLLMKLNKYIITIINITLLTWPCHLL